MRDAKDFFNASPSNNLYVCKSTIAMTDNFDIKNCTVVRKVEVGEALSVIDGADGKKDTEVEITRLKFKALRDGTSGWVTLKGNQGTLFVEPSKIHYTINRDVKMRSASTPDSPVVRILKKNEAFSAMAEPIEDQLRTVTVVRSRAMEDGASGWVVWSSGAAPVRPWKPRYVCRTPVPFTTGISATTPEVKTAEVGEIFEVVEGPTFDKINEVRRVKVAQSGATVGWATIRSRSGEVLLEVK